ncbi:U3 small nucleolar RNA-interacting protein 2-like isoform X1 [Ruditapes philippinarum]|uniref:U3 small nucleolar RNA-interacting protein 2-like isoform X1 n=1 Tax=Ruditapes philippinarum TaxID=129788 RepID=UPI00295C13AB|nr:U3 small nucleolar RNA-interacting protein 2-like isoform X1 [Ruditapes philippinarum]
MSFFIKNKGKQSQTKKKQGGKKRPAEAPKKGAPHRKKFHGLNEEIESDSEEEDHVTKSHNQGYSSSESDNETAQEKKLRLAKQYLRHIEAEERDNNIDDEVNRDAVSHRLKQDLLEQAGKLQKKLAENIVPPSQEDLILFRGHQLSVTCVVISPDSQFVYSGSKDCSIIKWSLKEKRKVHVIHGGRKGTEKKHVGHTGHVLAMALSSDGKYLASGDANKLIHIWDAGPMTLLHTFKGHRDAISGLTFRKETHQLYSCSHDRSVKIWNVDERAYVETLFGHQDKITAIYSLSRERAVTSGGRDSSIRIWKIIEESQLVFNAHSMCSVDCVALINEANFISGADDNSLSLWGAMKKKPLFTLKNAHGCQATDESKVEGQEENWITSVAALHNSDVVASAGSKDGSVRLWKCSADYKKLEPICAIPIVGFVNSLQFSTDGRYLIAGVGQEHRLGRWWSNKKAKNSIHVIPLATAVK